MLVVKHCKPIDRARMLAGHFKVGSHREYSKFGLTGLLSDDAEGRGATAVIGDIERQDVTIGGLRIGKLSIRGSSVAIKVDHDVNSSIFCASVGPYNSRRHSHILNGDAALGYAANSDVTAHLTLDAELLINALTLATNELLGAKTTWVGGSVVYRERIVSMPSDEFFGITNDEIAHNTFTQAFVKPHTYTCEEEFRFMMMPISNVEPPDTFLTASLSEEVREAFRAVIVDPGTDLFTP